MDRDTIAIETLKDIRNKLLERVEELKDAYTESGHNSIYNRISQLHEDINKIEKEETISEKELKEYALQAREIYNDLNLARCVRCGKHFSPDSIREHVKNCTKRRKKSDIEELNEYFDKEKRDKVIKRNRKSSMEHLKNIANEEIKYFHSLNVKIVQYRPKRSSKQIMENN